MQSEKDTNLTPKTPTYKADYKYEPNYSHLMTTGFATIAEAEAYDKGREHGENSIYKFLQDWKPGNANSALGTWLQRLHDKQAMPSKVWNLAKRLKHQEDYILDFIEAGRHKTRPDIYGTALYIRDMIATELNELMTTSGRPILYQEPDTCISSDEKTSTEAETTEENSI